jgi:cytosine deaminase
LGKRYRLRHARVAQSLLAPSVAAVADRDADGFALVDVEVAAGIIGDVRPAAGAPSIDQGGPDSPEAIGLEGRHLWPGFIDLHTHLDKGHIWPRARNADGAHATAARTVAEDRAARWSPDDLARRFDFGLRCAWAHGVSAIRTHIDSYAMDEARRGWRVFDEMRQQWAGRIPDQGVAMARVDAYCGPDADALTALPARGGGCLGGILRTAAPGQAESMERIDFCLDAMFGRAAALGLDIDLHVDETGDPAARGLEAVARAALRNHFSGQVTCGHCCALSVQPADVMNRTIDLVRRAGLAIVSLPMANLFLQDRAPGRTPRWRGIAPAQELAAAGIPTIAAGDNCRDPFFMFGDHDVLETWREFVRIAHLDLQPGVWAAAVTRTPADVMRLPSMGRIERGARADLVLFRARSVSELLARPQSDRITIRDGQPIDAALPDYAELDPLSATA